MEARTRGEASIFFASFAAVLRDLRGLKALGLLTTSPPPINRLPPYQPLPFIRQSFRPLAVRPPLSAKLLCISGSRHRILMPGNFPLKNIQRAPGVEIRGYNQHALAAAACQALPRVLRLVLRR